MEYEINRRAKFHWTLRFDRPRRTFSTSDLHDSARVHFAFTAKIVYFGFLALFFFSYRTRCSDYNERRLVTDSLCMYVQLVYFPLCDRLEKKIRNFDTSYVISMYMCKRSLYVCVYVCVKRSVLLRTLEHQLPLPFYLVRDLVLLPFSKQKQRDGIYGTIVSMHTRKPEYKLFPLKPPFPYLSTFFSSFFTLFIVPKTQKLIPL